ncbi:hypothetical protein, partial [Paenibacillus germinis]|uniref:hypothetical protein n=1 Tax=Paenibacillus germinis TaxID=2654979 RepID=UPI001C117E7C
SSRISISECNASVHDMDVAAFPDLNLGVAVQQVNAGRIALPGQLLHAALVRWPVVDELV